MVAGSVASMIRAMATKAAWNERARTTTLVPALPDAVAAFLDAAANLTRDDLERLTAADDRKPPVIWTAWELMRDRLDRAGLRESRLAAKRDAWASANASLAAVGLDPVADDGYWRIAGYVGAGACRAARFAACALVGPEVVEADVLALLLDPWRRAVPDRPGLI
jgi:hypothetical protein